jgi:hypothetical protein
VIAAGADRHVLIARLGLVLAAEGRAPTDDLARLALAHERQRENEQTDRSPSPEMLSGHHFITTWSKPIPSPPEAPIYLQIIVHESTGKYKSQALISALRRIHR